MDKKILFAAIILVVVAALVVLLILPATTITTHASYGLEYEGYSLARVIGTAPDGGPDLEAAGSSFESGQDVYLVIYGISGLQTQDGVAKIGMAMDVDSGVKSVETDPGGIDYPAEGGVIENIYSYVEGAELQPGKHSISLTLTDLLGGGYITVNAEFIIGPEQR